MASPSKTGGCTEGWGSEIRGGRDHGAPATNVCSAAVGGFGSGYFTTTSDENFVPFVSGLRMSATTATAAPSTVP